MPKHEEYMRVALSLAAKGLGRTSPNPAVGAIIVRRGLIVGKGFHKKAGLAHAEIAALDSIKKGGAKGATLYVTLEPCCNWGRTPPCTDAIISSGVKRVVVGTTDPNPLVSGRGVRELVSAGIEVITGVLEEECKALNECYNKFITKGLPFVTIKLAVTLDGRTASKTGESRWITGIEARRRVHRMRSMADGVLVGAGTVIKDDPLLTVRHVKGRDPLKVVVDTGFRIPLGAKVFNSGGGGLVVVTTKDARKEKMEKARKLGATVITVRKQKGRVDLRDALKALAGMNVVSLLVEGGPSIAASLIRERLADKLVLFIAPKLMGGDGLPAIGPLGVRGIDGCPAVKDLRAKKIGNDMLVEGYFMNEKNYVWYAGYGSNLDKQRFLCYIEGGTPKYGGKPNEGCKDVSRPVEEKEHTIPHELYFALPNDKKKTDTWGKGGVAFISPDRSMDKTKWTLCRMWKITREQYEGVREQEGRKKWYNLEIPLGEEDGVPIYTITNAKKLDNILKPSEAYLKTIASGLKETYARPTSDEIADYLSRKEGVGKGYTKPELMKIIEDDMNRR